ncbi:hypothetical protein Tco_1082246, partial [Tanacetum coccineum]
MSLSTTLQLIYDKLDFQGGVVLFWGGVLSGVERVCLVAGKKGKEASRGALDLGSQGILRLQALISASNDTTSLIKVVSVAQIVYAANMKVNTVRFFVLVLEGITSLLARECTYLDFMKCKPLYFKGTEGVVELTKWFERMEIVFRISNYIVENQIKFSTCTLLGSALTWWNSHVKTVGYDVIYAMTWTNLKKKMTNKYCPRGEIKKLEVEMMFPKESNKIERYVGGLPDMIHGSVMASKPKTMQDAIEFNKRQNTGRAYAVGSSEKKPYGVLQMPILLTTKGALRQVKNLHALNVEPRDISRGVSKAEKQQP